MKKPITSLFICILSGICAYAQDVILMKTAEEFNGRVLEITKSDIKYSKAGTIHTISISDIFSITYENGTIETYQDLAERESIKQTDYDSYPYPPVSREYKVGDIFDEGGVRGFVIHTTDNGRHGLIMSFTESEDDMCWGGFFKNGERIVNIRTGARSKTDGWENTRVINEIIENSELTWDDFPAFRYCREMGFGWYLPAIDEFMMIYNLSGGIPKTRSECWKGDKVIKEYLKSIGVKTLYDFDFDGSIIDSRGYATSTEIDVENIWFPSYPSYYKIYQEQYVKGEKETDNTSLGWSDKSREHYFVRAVHKF